MNSHVTIFSSSARGSGATNSNMITNHSAKGGIFWLEVTAVSGSSPTLDVKIQGYDPDGDDWVDLGNNVAGTGAYAFAQKTGAGQDQLTVYPGLTASGNAVCSGILPNQIRAVGTVGGSSTPTVTYTLGVDFIEQEGRMANELRHSDVGTALSKSEWEAVGGHIFNSQAAGDIMYASTTSQLSRLGIGSANQVLATNSGATAPEWVTSVASATLAATVTVVDSTDTSSYIAMFDSATGSLAAKTDAGLTYNAGTGMLTATGFTGPLTGTLVTAAQGNVTSLGTLTTLTVDSIIINGTNIGHTSDTDAIAISSGGVVTMNQIPVFSAGISVSGGTIAGTLATAAQGNVTSLGTLTALTVDDVAIDGKVITMTGSASDTAVFTVGTNGTLSIVTTDDAAAAANIQITADGTVDIDSAGVLTLDSGAAINIEPASGSAILLDGTISVDAGVVTGATSITSSAYVVGSDTLAEYIADTVGAMTTSNTESGITVAYQDADNTLDFTVGTLNQDTTGTAANATHVTVADNESTDENDLIPFIENASATGNVGLESDGDFHYNPSTGRLTATQLAGTLQTAAQGNITSLGTLTTLTVDNVITNGTTIGHTDDTDLMTLADGVLTVTGNLDVSGSLEVPTIDFTDGDNAITIADTGITTFPQQATFSKGIVVTAADSAADDGIATGTGTGLIATMRAVTGIGVGELVHIDANGDLDEAHADASADMPAIGIALTANTSGSDANIQVLLQGFYRDDTLLSFGTKGAPVYVDHSAEGDFTLSPTTTDGHFIQRVGISVTDDMIYFSPSLDVIERD